LGPVSGVQRTYAGDPVPPCAGFFDLAGEEKCAILELVGDCKRVIEKTEKLPSETVQPLPAGQKGPICEKSFLCAQQSYSG
jgi:hypothetical protein